MIYCIQFNDFASHVIRLGYRLKLVTEQHSIYENANGDIVMVEGANGQTLPEMLANNALDAAELPVPMWDVFWCD